MLYYEIAIALAVVYKSIAHLEQISRTAKIKLYIFSTNSNCNSEFVNWTKLFLKFRNHQLKFRNSI